MRRLRFVLAACRFLAYRVGLYAVLLLIIFQTVAVGTRIATRSLGNNPDSPTSFQTQISTIFTPEVQHWNALIVAWAIAYKVDPNLVATVIQIESCGNPNVVSSSGAQGLFQVMPSHFSAGEDPLEVLTNGRRGMEYLVGGLQIASGDAGLALAGYNGGHRLISEGRNQWPAETRRYYRWGTGIYTDALRGNPTSATLQEWLQAGGEQLCERASMDLLIARR